jgi:1-acyl-sn-glycerol-3-phosphate acyltransferase
MFWFLTFSLVLIAGLIYIGQQATVVDWGGKRINWIDGFGRFLCRHIHHLDDKNQIPLPATGPAIVVANHVSGLDPFLLLAACKRPLRFLVAREEYDRPILNWLFRASGCIPVDRVGRPEKALREALRALQQGEVIAIFPHGRILLDDELPHKIKGGVARLAIWSEATIYPVRINGVGGEGQVALAPVIPSKVVLNMGTPLQCQITDMKACLASITADIGPQTAK